MIEENAKYSAWTKFDYKRALRTFYKWLHGIPWNENKFPELVDWISIKMSKRNHKLPSDLLTKDDIKRLVDAANNIRDKALIMTLYEGGLRIGELLNMKIKDVEFNGYGAKIKVNGKTGERVLLLISSTSLLASWLECHPFREDRDAYLWLGINASNYRKQLKYSAIRSNLVKIAKRAGLKKRVNPHIFRHSRATELAKHLTEAQMCVYFGWEIGSSKMPGVYVHLSMKDIEDAILKIHGKKQVEEPNELTDKTCPRCKQVNSSISKYCSTCGLLLDEEQAINMVQVGKDLIPLSAVKEMIRAEFERMKKEFKNKAVNF